MRGNAFPMSEKGGQPRYGGLGRVAGAGKGLKQSLMNMVHPFASFFFWEKA